MADRSGARNANWRGGRRRGGEGGRYWLICSPGHPRASQGAVLEHRLVMERELGRYLTADEVVHHRNGDTLDNRPENLEVMSQSEHARLHAPTSLLPHGYRRPPAERVGKHCEHCAARFMAVGKKERSRRFCSQRCYWDYRTGRGRLEAGATA